MHQKVRVRVRSGCRSGSNAQVQSRLYMVKVMNTGSSANSAFNHGRMKSFAVDC